MSSVMKKYDTVFTSTNVRKWFTDVWKLTILVVHMIDITIIQLLPVQHRDDEDYQSDMYRHTIQKATALSAEWHNGNPQEMSHLMSS